MPLNIKNMPLLAGYLLTKEDIISNEEFIMEFNYVKDNVKYLYIDSSDSDLHSEVDKVGSLVK